MSIVSPLFLFEKQSPARLSGRTFSGHASNRNSLPPVAFGFTSEVSWLGFRLSYLSKRESKPLEIYDLMNRES